MKKTKQIFNLFTAVVFTAILSFQIFSTVNQASAAYARIRLTPDSNTLNTNTNFTVTVSVETDYSVNAVKIFLVIPTNLVLVSENNSVSAFPTKYPTTPQGQTYEISQSSSAQVGNLSGNLKITELTFRSAVANTYNIGVSSASYVYNFPSTTNLVTSWGSGTSYTINNPAPPGGGGGGTPKPPTGGSGSKPTSSKPSSSVSTPQSQTTQSGLQISDFEIKDIGYRSAIATWKTNKPATSSVKYGENPDELSSELKDEGQKTDHRIVIEGENVKAGRTYFVNVSSSDGSEPAQIDGEFSTTAIPVLIKVLDSEGKPVADASAYTETAEGMTNADGQVTLDLPEGDVKISAVKDNYFGEIDASILIPDADASIQEVTVSLTVLTDGGGDQSGSSSAIWLYIILFLILLGLGIWGFIFWKRRRTTDDGYYGDPLVNNYPTTPLPGTVDTQTDPSSISDPSLTPSPEQNYVPHYQSLPELLKTETPQEPVSRFDTEPQDMFEKANGLNEDQPTIDNPFASEIPDASSGLPQQPEAIEPYPNPYDIKTEDASLDNFSDTDDGFSLDTSPPDKSDSPESSSDSSQSEDGTLIINHEK